jgi:hypothetical protein
MEFSHVLFSPSLFEPVRTTEVVPGYKTIGFSAASKVVPGYKAKRCEYRLDFQVCIFYLQKAVEEK